MNLEDVIRNAAAKGDISHLTLALSSRGWVAGYRSVDKGGYAIGTQSDPVDALKEAMLGPRALKKALPVKTKSKFEDLVG